MLLHFRFHLYLCILLFCLVSGNDHTACHHDSSSSLQDKDKEQDFPSYVVKHIRGRLGNHIWGAMMAIGLQETFGVQGLMTRESEEYLLKYFEPTGIPVAERDPCGYEEYYTAFLNHLDHKILDFYEDKLGYRPVFERGESNRMNVPPEISAQVPISTYSIIENPSFFDDFKPEFTSECAYAWQPFMNNFTELALPENRVNRHWHLHPASAKGNGAMLYQKEGFKDRLLQKLRLRDHFLQGADEKLRRIQEQHRSIKKKKREFVFVGIHCRRTDHIAFELERNIQPIHYSYFLEAMDLFREEFGKKFNVVFVFVSDDMEWGRQKLATKNRRKDLYFVGEGIVDKEQAIGADLALLARCNHTIQSHGSYSFFAGVLADGIRVTPDHFAIYRTEESWVIDVTKHPIKEPLPNPYFFSSMEKIPKRDRGKYNER